MDYMKVKIRVEVWKIDAGALFPERVLHFTDFKTAHRYRTRVERLGYDGELVFDNGDRNVR